MLNTLVIKKMYHAQANDEVANEYLAFHHIFH